MKLKDQCQSCGLPRSQDPQGGGSEADGSKSALYCSYCYRDGAFIGPDCSVTQMQDIVDRKLKERGASRLLRMFARWQIPRLKRWRS